MRAMILQAPQSKSLTGMLHRDLLSRIFSHESGGEQLPQDLYLAYKNDVKVLGRLLNADKTRE